MTTKLRLALACWSALAAVNAGAATKTWDGSSSGNWATAANWSGGTVPVAGDDLVFPGGVTRLAVTNDFSPNRNFNSLTFLGTNYTVRGNSIILTNGIRMGTLGNTQASPNTNTIEANIQLQAAETFRVTNLFSKLIISGDVALNPGCLEVSGTGDTEIDGVVSGACGITKSGFGFLTLAGNNTFSGTVFITDGRIIASDPSFSGNTPLGDTLGGTILQGGLLEIRVSVTNEALLLWGGVLFNNRDPGRWQGSIIVQSNSFIDVAGSFTIDGVISGNADLQIDQLFAVSSWECTLAGSANNTLTGELWLRDGRLVLNKTTAVAIDGPLKLGGGSTTNAVVREKQNSQIAVVPITILTNAVLDLDGHSDGVGGVALIGGTLTNNGTGLFTINGNISAAYATRRSDIYGNISLASITRTFFVTNSDDTTGTELNVHDEIRGTAGFVKAGDGYMGLLASNSYSGLTTISAGTLLVQDDFGLGSTNSGTVVSNGATLYIASSTVPEPLTLNGDGDTIESRSGALRGLIATCSGPITVATDSTINVPSASPFNLTLSGVVSGAGGVTKTGVGTLIYSGTDDNTYSGDTLVKAGILQLNKTSAFAINNSAALIIGDSSDGAAADIVRYSQNQQILSTADIFINRTGLLDLNNFTDDVGDISMVAGTIDTGTGALQLRGNLTAIGDTSGLTFYPAQIIGNLDLGSTARTFTVNNNPFASGLGTDLEIDAAVTVGSGTWTKNGAGEMALTHSNSFTGPLIVRDGRLIVTDPNALGGTTSGLIISNTANLELSGDLIITGKALTLDTANAAYGAIYSLHGTNTWAGPVTLTRTAVLFVESGSGVVLSDAISGVGGVTKIGSGVLTYSGSLANSYAGITTVNAGTLLLAKSSANNSILGPLIIGDGSGGANADVVRLQGTSQLGNVAVTVNSSGLFDLNGITETFGSLAGSGNVTLGGATLNPGGDGSSTLFSGTISETGAFTKAGSGTMTLSGPNSYTGITTISAGTLLVNGSQPQSPVTINSSGTLGGTGTVGHVTVIGSIAPGASPGILTSSNLTFSASGDFFVELNGPTAGTDYDQINVHGTNNLGGATLHVIPFFSSPVSVGQQFTIINNDGAEPVTGTFNALPENSGFNAGGYGFRINYAAGTGNDVVLTLTNIPVDFFFTNSLGGDFFDAPNWIPNAVPGPTNNANFTNNASYTVSWSANVSNANAFFNVTNGTVTESLGAFSWLITNSYVIGQNAATTATVTHASGALRVTNGANNALLEVRRGTNRLNGGVIETDRLLLTNKGGVFEFSGGTLISRGGTVSNLLPFNIGVSGVTPAIWDVRSGTDHVVASNVLLGAAVSNNRLFVTNGGRLFNRAGNVGSTSAAGGNAVVLSSSGSVWSNSANLVLGSASSFNQLTISNGAKAAALSLLIGNSSAANSNRVVVSGAGSSLEITDTVFGDLDVGVSGSVNSLIISNGATLLADGTLLFDIGQQLTSSNNTLLVDGPGTVITNVPGAAPRITVGGSGSGNTATFSGGARAYVAGITLAGDSAASRSNNVLIQGAGTFVDTAAGTTLGVNVGLYGSNNTLQILGGAVVKGLLSVGYDTNAANNTTIISGVGSAMTNSSFNYQVGIFGPGNLLLVSAGGKVSVPEVELGNGPTATNNRIVVTGSGSFFQQTPGTRFLLVGSSGNSIVVSNGATLYPWDFRLGAGNQTIVTDPGTLFTNEAFFTVSGRMVVSNGATLGTRAQTASDVALNGSGATLTVTDAGSAWECSGNPFSIGLGATNTSLLISNGGFVRAPNFIVGNFAGDNGNTLQLTGSGSRLTNSLNAPTLQIGKGGANNRLLVGSGARVDLFTTGGSELAKTVLGTESTATSNSLVVAGSNARLTSPTLLIGSNGPASQMIISNAGFVSAAIAVLGVSDTASNNLAALAGPGLLWSNSVLLVVGSNAPANSLIVSNGATLLANSLVLGNNSSSTNNSALLLNAQANVTNFSASASLDVRRGAFTLQGGTLTADRLLLTNGGQSLFTFNAGQLNVRTSTVANGVTFFVGDGSSPSTLNLVGNGRHSFANGLTLRSNASLIGNGVITGAVTVLNGATFAPGTSVGRIALSNTPALLGALVMELSKTGSTLTNDQIQVAGPLTYGGTLTVNNIGPDAPALGDRFPLFSAASYSGAFSSTTLPVLNSGLAWTNKLLIDGSIQVVATSRPQFVSLALSGTNLIMSGSGGVPSTFYVVLSSTNVTLPVISWLPLSTNQFDSSGNFIFTNALSPAIPQRFYLLRVP